jgi:septum formation protein
MNQATLCLASASPRRAELLRQIGVSFRSYPVDIDESRTGDEPVLNFVQRIAGEKANEAWRELGGAEKLCVLAADTVVVVADAVFGKPRDSADCVAMLGRLSGRTHVVLTAVALRHGGGMDVRYSRSRVRFRVIPESERLAYWGSGEPRDKAGAYAIQGLGAVFVRRIEGSYSGVMGLPLFETAAMLQSRGLFRIARSQFEESV